MYLDEKVNFLQYIKEKTLKADRGIRVIRKLRHILARLSLMITYKSFVRPQFHYCDIIYVQPNYKIFCNKTETVQYKVALAITSAIVEISQRTNYWCYYRNITKN